MKSLVTLSLPARLMAAASKAARSGEAEVVDGPVVVETEVPLEEILLVSTVSGGGAIATLAAGLALLASHDL